MVRPSGWTRARYSPLRLRAKLVCSSAPVRFLLEAKMMRVAPALRVRVGNVHLVRSAALSVRYQPVRSTAAPVGLCTSIQSANVPSSSASVVTLLAMNSVMSRGPAPPAAAVGKPRPRNKPKARSIIKERRWKGREVLGMRLEGDCESSLAKCKPTNLQRGLIGFDCKPCLPIMGEEGGGRKL